MNKLANADQQPLKNARREILFAFTAAVRQEILPGAVKARWQLKSKVL